MRTLAPGVTFFPEFRRNSSQFQSFYIKFHCFSLNSLVLFVVLSFIEEFCKFVCKISQFLEILIRLSLKLNRIFGKFSSKFVQIHQQSRNHCHKKKRLGPIVSLDWFPDPTQKPRSIRVLANCLSDNNGGASVDDPTADSRLRLCESWENESGVKQFGIRKKGESEIKKKPKHPPR